LSTKFECSDSTTDLEIGIFSEIPWHVIGIFPRGVIFIETKWRADVGIATNEKYQILIQEGKVKGREPNKSKKVTHCSNSEIRHQVHSVSVDLIDGILVVDNSAVVRVENTEIKWGITYCGLAALIFNWGGVKI
jgi:hypothetical protein